ncbi:hypothetical protein F3Y22_tig00111238pilonHSYRG00393 [Hibiscus syriacus]|uniref:Reticulon-like protein n=1 Tax=Hibiscus syriacus TaxID=106335 RepID=A0A6A2YUA9_HIBSY|nr:hypothetical protein F3Y22_tig00111238pilonHSYRG00393 [Hibiscus syriacus]
MSFRRGEAKSSVVAAGSVWETRMKSDEVKGGINVFNGDENGNGGGATGNKRLSLKKGQTIGGVVGKRKTWKNESFGGLEKNPIQISKSETQIQVPKGRSLEHCKDLTIDGVYKKSPVQENKSVDGTERSPFHMKKTSSEVPKKSAERSKEGNEAGERMEIGGMDLSLEENCKEFWCVPRKCHYKQWKCGRILGSSAEVSVVDDDEDFSEEEEEIVKSAEDIKEMNIPEKKPDKVTDEMKKLQEIKPAKPVKVKKLQEHKPSKVVNEVKKISQFHNRTAPVVKYATPLYKTPTKVAKSSPSSGDYHYQSFQQTRNKGQNLGAMWRDVSKSALVFRMGTFIIILSSYTQDLNISFISAISYMCLVYLAAIFLYKSTICRGVVDTNESSYVVGEEEAFWLLKLVLT